MTIGPNGKEKAISLENFQHYEFLIPTTNYAQTFVEIRFIIQVTIKYLGKKKISGPCE